MLSGEAVIVPALLEQAEFSAAGGRYRLGETMIDPAERNQAVELEVVDLELATLFKTADIEGLSGTGSVRGVIPIVVKPEGIAIAKARLRAQSPGVLRFESEAASQALATGGEPVELMLRALQEFHYEKLSLSANKTADGEARLRLRMLGQNPDVLEGHPFRFNINLTGNLNPILNAIAKGRNISSNLLSRTWRLQR